METMAEFSEDSDMNRKVYLPLLEDTDECRRRSSASLNELAYETMLSINPARSQSLKMGYIANLVSEGAVSPCSLILGLLYIKRLSQINPSYVSNVSPRDVFLTALLIASKYMNDEGEDEALTNSQWAAAGYKEKEEVDQLERRFLSAIDWRLYVSMQEYYPFVANVQKRIAISQLKQRGWATYTDLTTIWQASDVEETMLSASKQTAKVTCATSFVYLMCVATLLAASHSLHATYTTGSDLASTESDVVMNSTFHNKGACLGFGGQWHANGTIPNTLHQLRRSEACIKSVVQKPTWRSDHASSSGLGTYQSTEQHSPVDHQKEKEIWNGVGSHRSSGWNETGPHHSSGWKGTVYHASPENNGNRRSGQGNNYVGITQGKLDTNTTYNGSVAEMHVPRRCHFSPQLEPSVEASQGGGARLNLEPNSLRHYDRAEQNGDIEVKYNSHQAHINTSTGSMSFPMQQAHINTSTGSMSFPMQQTTLHTRISTSSMGRRYAGGGSGSVGYLPQQGRVKSPPTIDRWAKSKVILAEALPWLQTTPTPWLLA
eukprot:Em0012g1034a